MVDLIDSLLFMLREKFKNEKIGTITRTDCNFEMVVEIYKNQELFKTVNKKELLSYYEELKIEHHQKYKDWKFHPYERVLYQDREYYIKDKINDKYLIGNPEYYHEYNSCCTSFYCEEIFKNQIIVSENQLKSLTEFTEDEDLKWPINLTIKQLKTFINELPEDALDKVIYYERINDSYFKENKWKTYITQNEVLGEFRTEYIKASGFCIDKKGNILITGHY